MKKLLLPLAIVATTGCDEIFGDTVCTASAEPAVVVEVVDADTDDAITDAIVWVQDGEFVDTLDFNEGLAAGAHERPGTYDVHVEAEGYAPWSQEDVVVRDGECHVRTRELTAELVAE